jgi:hypothetical protein
VRAASDAAEGGHVSEAELTVRYLVERMAMNGRHGGLTGRSSDAMVLACFTDDDVPRWHYPLDRPDWRRCLLAYALAPEFLRERMRPTMRSYRAELRRGERWRWAWGCEWPRADWVRLRRKAATVT